jgi:hypothetical protein
MNREPFACFTSRMIESVDRIRGLLLEPEAVAILAHKAKDATVHLDGRTILYRAMYHLNGVQPETPAEYEIRSRTAAFYADQFQIT